MTRCRITRTGLDGEYAYYANNRYWRIVHVAGDPTLLEAVYGYVPTWGGRSTWIAYAFASTGNSKDDLEDVRRVSITAPTLLRLSSLLPPEELT